MKRIAAEEVKGGLFTDGKETLVTGRKNAGGRNFVGSLKEARPNANFLLITKQVGHWKACCLSDKV